MAAILCKGIGDCFTSCCKCCTAPCNLISTLCNNPFCLYVTSALICNIPPIAMGIPKVISSFLGCKGSLWLFADIIFCGINIAAAIYVAIKYRDRNESQNTGFHRAKEILCYDPVIAIYILVLLGHFAWCCLGVTWQGQYIDYGYDDCDPDIPSLVKTCYGFGFVFIFVGTGLIWIGLCCSCCMNGASSNDNVVYQMSPSQRPDVASTDDVEKNTKVPATNATAVPIYNNGEPIYAATVVDNPTPSAPPEPTINSKLESTKEKLTKAANKVSNVAKAGFDAIKKEMKK